MTRDGQRATPSRKLVKGMVGMVWPGRRTFSQFAEDVFIDNYFRGQRDGTWLDIGAFHPRVSSNTLRLRRRGWRGVNVDADDVKVQLFRWFRRRDVNFRALMAGPGGGRAVLRSPEAAEPGSYGSMDRIQFADEPGAEPTRTVTDVLDEAGIDHLDLVSIDVEGLEGPILEGFPFERVAPALFCVEILAPTLDEVLSSPVTGILSEHGYQLVGWHPPSVFYAREPRPAEGQ
jgi:FkbM family methyltransferase